MSETFVCADLHLSHRGIVQFKNEDGSKVRPWDTTEDMDEALISNWNLDVRPQDKVYVLGDVVINRRALPLIGKLNGTKILVGGNHDVWRLEELTPYFKDIRGSTTLSGMILTHIPIHPQDLGRWGTNVHGHLHNKRVIAPDGAIDPRYYCVSMEHINYTPIPLFKLIKRIKEQQIGNV